VELDSADRTRQHGGMTDQIVRIRITLEDMKPAIWRRVELPVTNSLKTLHLAIQACMLFENYHLFRFDVGDAAYGIRFDDDDAFMVRTPRRHQYAHRQARRARHHQLHLHL
jgi:hypothetical protein